jgi:hypothetical protein
MCALIAVEGLESNDPQDFVVSVAKPLVDFTNLVSEFVIFKEGDNELPPVHPHQLAKLNTCRFVTYVNEHRERLEHIFSVEINRICDTLSQLQRAYREE